MKSYWVPRFKWQLVEWLTVRYPKDRHKFERMPKKRLLAAYYKIMEKVA